MYSMDDLFYLAATERAEALKLRIGEPPVIVVRGEHHVVEGPDITAENAEQFLLSITNTRQRRHFRERGWLQFFYMYRGLKRFLILIRLDGENVEFDIE